MKLKCASGEKITIVKSSNGVIVVYLPNNKYRHFVYWDEAKKFVKELDIT